MYLIYKIDSLISVEHLIWAVCSDFSSRFVPDLFELPVCSGAGLSQQFLTQSKLDIPFLFVVNFIPARVLYILLVMF
jgi:hypothetical protein